MPFDGSGNFTRVMNWVNDAAANIKIKADRHDSEDNNFASGLSNVITKDGQTAITADIPWNGKKITGLANPTNPQDAATKNYVDVLRSFSTGIALPGAGAANRIEWTAGGMSFFVRSVGDPAGSGMNENPRWVWNQTATGASAVDDVVTLSKGGALTVGMNAPNPLHITAGNIAFNTYFNGSNARWQAIKAGKSAYLTHDLVSGDIQIVTGASAAADGAVTGTAKLRIYSDTALMELPNSGTFRMGGTAFKYYEHNSTHVAYYKQAGAHYFTWRKSNNGYQGGGDEVILATLDDAGGWTLAGGISAASNISTPTNMVSDVNIAASFSGKGSGGYFGDTGGIYLRPNGYSVSTNQVAVQTNGNMAVAGVIFSASKQVLTVANPVEGQNSLDFPVGQYLFAHANTSAEEPMRNATVFARIEFGSRYNTSIAGTALTGAWVSRGNVPDAPSNVPMFLIQRVA